ncbi:hypothetical protein [Novosphingobium mangrovi (ex Hu et al. 2023)]|uniref:Protein NO VEIN C-terminal domain-containing protein n=1 Tax=Novosphingobium mangrovi (ex Hu et al. 2023) TaxID=2930094 RepID=A0ABT0AFW9_9SPHN|nr:hypothetical protein [Novosphingobium mangrovi (ex Hu et al. 2023)]MCJ1962074.1 hypothetical protein [Novosphingobium mangrovi (ex Hu et al. 2023)]
MTATIYKPILFSTYFGVDPDVLNDAGFLDPFTNIDTPLFVDPVLLEKSNVELIRTSAIARFREHFSRYVRLLALSKNEGDPAWKAAAKLLDLDEPPENGLGFGGSGRSGSSRPEDIQVAILRTTKLIIALGADDPEMISLMGFFEEGVGPDTISDFTTRVIMPELLQLTKQFCDANNVPVRPMPGANGGELPCVVDANGRERFMVLVPRDIVRDLPLANDWSDLEDAVNANQEVRDRVNALLGQVASNTVEDRKSATKAAALADKDTFEAFLAAVKAHADNYDPNDDMFAYFKLKDIVAHGFPDLPGDGGYDLSKGPDEVYRLVIDTIEFFAHHVERGNLWEELWIDGKPKRERAAQLIYFAIADAYCRANNVDISPEAHMGGGPIDFKFSVGYDVRVLVEMKRSGGQVKHGYEKQLEIYLDAARTNLGVFVIMDFGDLGRKLDAINEIRQARIDTGERASKIIVIDSTQKASASKRI